jgi:hypothetical protein
MPELDLSADAIQFIIDKVHEFHSRDDVMLPDDDEEESIDADTLAQFAADYSSDPYYQELTDTINDMDPDQQIKLVALMWVGRGDYDLDEWDDAVGFAEETWTDHTAEYLVSTPLLADYLAEGLQLFEAAEE